MPHRGDVISPGEEPMIGVARGGGADARPMPIHQVVAHAARAPNPQNRQPWRVRPYDRGFTLFLDPSRVAKETDPFARQAHLSLGAFLETAAVAATALGHSPRIQLFPDGTDPPDALGTRPVAIVDLAAGSDRSASLFEQIAVRHTNRRAYEGRPLTAGEDRALRDATDAPSTLVIVRDDDTRRELRAALIEAMAIDTSHGATHGEKIRMIRASDDDAAAAGDGFTYPNLGYTGRARSVVERLYPLSGASSRWFRHGTMLIARRVTRHAPAFGVLLSPGNTRVDQIETGRALVRIWLTATDLGLALHPMCQVLQERAEQLPAQSVLRGVLDRIAPDAIVPTGELTPGISTVQLIVRLGRAAPTPPSPRRPVAEVIAG